MGGVTTYTQDFPNAGGGILDVFASVLPINIGVPTNVSKSTYAKYVVTISSSYDPAGIWATSKARKPVNISAFLQEKINMEISSTWKTVGFFPPDLANAGAQVLTGRTLASTVASRRIWTGSDPLKMNLLLRFEAFDNILSDVLEPVSQLQAMVCAREGGVGGNFLIPPGPNPFKFTLNNGTVLGAGDVIVIKVGQFLTFKSVVIESVSVEWDPRMGVEGPLGATVNLRFATYEMLTQEKIQDLYNGAVQVTGSEIEPKQPVATTESVMAKAGQAGVVGMVSEATSMVIGNR